MKFVSEDFGNSELARRFGVTRYPALFVNDVLTAKPKDFGFYGKGEGAGDGRYTPFKSAESHKRLQDDLRRNIELALAGRAAGADASPSGAPPSEPSELESLPDLHFKDLSGNAVTRDDLLGKVVLVEFWATWCPPCRSTLRFLGELKRKFGDRLVIVAPAVESDEGDVAIVAAAEPSIRFGLVTPDLARQFGDINAVPTMHLFDGKGARIHSFYGAPPTLHADAEKLIENLARGGATGEIR